MTLTWYKHPFDEQSWFLCKVDFIFSNFILTQYFCLKISAVAAVSISGAVLSCSNLLCIIFVFCLFDCVATDPAVVYSAVKEEAITYRQVNIKGKKKKSNTIGTSVLYLNYDSFLQSETLVWLQFNSFVNQVNQVNCMLTSSSSQKIWNVAG